MKKYKITLRRPVFLETTVEVEAECWYEARLKAFRRSRSILENADAFAEDGVELLDGNGEDVLVVARGLLLEKWDTELDDVGFTPLAITED